MQKFNYHSHTYRCMHSDADMLDEDYIKDYIKMGFEEVAFTDHCPEKNIIDKRPRIRMLYEFTSAITPSAAGGSTLEMLFIHKEGVKFGKSTAITIISLFFDELFFVIGFPILLLILPIDLLFAVEGTFSAAILSVFAIAYLSKVASLDKYNYKEQVQYKKKFRALIGQ